MSLPMHARVAEELRGRIGRGELVPGAALPSEAQLCEQFGASRFTVREADDARADDDEVSGQSG